MWSVVVKVFQQILAHGLLFGGIWFIVDSNLLHDAQNKIGVVSYVCATFGGFLMLWTIPTYFLFPQLMPAWIVRTVREKDLLQVRTPGFGVFIVGAMLVCASSMLVPFDSSWAPSRQQGGPFIYIIALLGLYSFLVFMRGSLKVVQGIEYFQINRDGISYGYVGLTEKKLPLENFERLEVKKASARGFKALFVYGEGTEHLNQLWKKEVQVKDIKNLEISRVFMGGLSAQEIEDFILRLKEEEQAQAVGSS